MGEGMELVNFVFNYEPKFNFIFRWGRGGARVNDFFSKNPNGGGGGSGG